jgi:hypothetical protein
MRAPYQWGRHLRRNVEFVQLNHYWDVFTRIQYCKMGQRHRMNRKQDRASSNCTIMHNLVCRYAVHALSICVIILLCPSPGLDSTQTLKVQYDPHHILRQSLIWDTFIERSLSIQVNVQLSPSRLWRRKVGEVELHSFLTSTEDGGERLSSLGCFIPGNKLRYQLNR